MIRVLLLVIVITLGFILYKKYQKLPPAQQRKMLWRMATGGFIGLLVLLVATGRMHWVGAVLGALLPFVRIAFGLLMQVLPMWLQRKQAASNSQDNPEGKREQPAANTATISVSEALEVLGLKGDLKSGAISREMINNAHRSLIQKLHPDRGGNDYLAAKINQARDTLLSALEQSH